MKQATRSRGGRSKSATARKPWADREVAALKKLIRENTPTRVIAMKLDRTETAVRGKCQALGWSLRPANRSPYG
jgi:hypothetical protein